MEYTVSSKWAALQTEAPREPCKRWPFDQAVEIDCWEDDFSSSFLHCLCWKKLAKTLFRIKEETMQKRTSLTLKGRPNSIRIRHEATSFKSNVMGWLDIGGGAKKARHRVPRVSSLDLHP